MRMGGYFLSLELKDLSATMQKRVTRPKHTLLKPREVMHLLQDLLEIVYSNYVQTIKSKLLFICLWLTVLSAVLQRDHGNQAKTKVQQLGLRQKSFASGLAIIPPLFGWIYYSRRPKEAFLQCLCLSLRHGAETVSPRVHCTRSTVWPWLLSP